MECYHFLEKSKKDELHAFLERFYKKSDSLLDIVIRLSTHSNLISKTERSKLKRFNGQKVLDFRQVHLYEDELMLNTYFAIDDFVKPLGHILYEKVPLMQSSLFLDVSIKPIDAMQVFSEAAANMLRDNVQALSDIRLKNKEDFIRKTTDLLDTNSYAISAIENSIQTNKSNTACIKAEYVKGIDVDRLLKVADSLCKNAFVLSTDYMILMYRDGFDIVYDKSKLTKDLYQLIVELEKQAQTELGKNCFVKRPNIESTFVHCPATFYAGSPVSVYKFTH